MYSQNTFKHKSLSIFTLIKEELVNINQIFLKLNEINIKSKLESVGKLEVMSECELMVKEIRKKRENILDIIKSNDNSIYLKLKNSDILLISHEVKKELLKNYENSLSTYLNGYSNVYIRILLQFAKVHKLILNTKSQNLKLYLYIVYNHLFKNLNNVTNNQLNQIGVEVLRNWYLVEISSDYIDDKVIKVLQQSINFDVQKLSNYYLNMNYHLQFLLTNSINKNHLLNVVKTIAKPFLVMNCCLLLTSCLNIFIKTFVMRRALT